MITNYPTQRELQEVFELRVDFRNGYETLWRKNDNNTGKWKNKGEWLQVKCKANDSEGYCCVGFKGRSIKYHTIVWILANGNIPEELMVDHISGDKVDNQTENLRLATSKVNNGNKECHRNGKLLGCTYIKHTKKWRASIVINNRQIPLGYYGTELEAHTIYLKAAELVDQFVDNNQFRKLLLERKKYVV